MKNKPSAIAPQRSGSIEVICGPMFSGKTEELIRRMRRAEIAGLSVEIYKPKMDTRYDAELIVSHNQNSIRSTPVDNAESILLFSSNVAVVGIDEAQFFDENLMEVAIKLAFAGTKVILAGLDMDYLGFPFANMPFIMAVAETVTKLTAVCTSCGADATHTYRTVSNANKIMLGEKEAYEPRCRTCFNANNRM